MSWLKEIKVIVTYNLPEGKDREEDKLSVLSLLKTAYDLESQINRVSRLGKRIENKRRPLLGQQKTRILLFRIHTYYATMISFKRCGSR